ncbi:glycosyltransferase family 4 protein [Psychrobium sp. MM17-31]|uniref:glycosyltransferase family 4 protein n=1 Tax=Psychrobium sp. MM17-31 TaxID=2917758 RepID=UPI001EF43C16|nr:glycosyltransferase family 4 protein [Psychrobium sp. MM17-31]MCG7531146.1 glycosyltransferase family 4 protein [Psychrobium sp. MM17-31]
MKILHVLNSDFGLASTMGYRSYQIVKNSSRDIKVFCRANLSRITGGSIATPYPGSRLYSRMTQYVLKTLGDGCFYSFFKNIEINAFSFRAKKYIESADVVHFFYHDEKLIDYAKGLNKKVIIEAFSHPDYLKRMRREGIKFDSNNETSDDHSIPCYLKSDLIVSPSEWVNDNLEFAGIHKDNVEFIPYGVHKQKDRNYCVGKPLKIVFAGGLKRTKGVLELVEAVTYFPKETIELKIFGRLHNSIASELEELMSGNDNICIMGFNDDIIKQYQNADIYVYPTYFEGSSKTVFEAMSCGLPVITTFNAGSIVRDEIDGFIVPINNPAAIAEKLNLFLDNPDLIKKMGSSAQNYSRLFSWERYAQNVDKIYSEYLS